MPAEPLRILLLEDTDSDAELVQRALRRGELAFDLRRVETEAAFTRELHAWNPEVVLADYRLPTFDGLAALEIVRLSDAGLPFIFVSGTLGDEKAVEVLKLGATDYVLKDRLSRLVPAIQRALSEYEQRAARRRIEAQLERTRRLDSLGRVAGTIAHEVNNVLMSIQMVMEPLRAAPDPGMAERVADQITLAVRRAQRVTTEVARFTTPVSPEVSVVDLKNWIETFAGEIRAFLGEKILLEVQVPPDAMNVNVDIRQIEQVVTNLASNARDAMDDGGQVRLDLRGVTQEGRRYAEITLTDTGSGVPPDVHARLFEPLFTTKRTGTGLGLAVSHQMVVAHGGLIYAESEPGVGTQFHVLLPMV
jgi:signal transduction histidine kinase